MTAQTKTPPLGQFILSALVTALIFPAAILLLAGNWLWLEGWIFAKHCNFQKTTSRT